MLAAQMELILLATGAATVGALSACAFPTATMTTLFGGASSNALNLLIVRHWGLVVGLIGALIIYAAYHTEIRAPTLVVAIVEKTAFALGIFGSPLRKRPLVLGMALADAGMAAVYAAYLAIV